MKVNKFQEGGQMAPEEAQGAPMEQAPEQGGNEQQMALALQEMAMQIAQQLQDPQLISMLGQMLMEIAQGGALPAEPVMRRNGGKLVRA